MAENVSEATVDIRQVDPDSVLAEAAYAVGGTLLEMSIRPIEIDCQYYDYVRAATRQTFGLFMNTPGGRPELVEVIASPQRYSARDTSRYAVQHEAAVIDALNDQPPSPLLVNGMPHAQQRSTDIYETSAPGVPLGNEGRNQAAMLPMLADAHRKGDITVRELALLVICFHTSARDALDELHQRGIRHWDPHTLNFNVDPRTGLVTILDYGDSVAKGRPETIIDLRWSSQGVHTADEPEEDNAVFEERWAKALKDAGLEPALLDSFESEEMAAAIAKLEPLLFRAILARVGLEAVADHDVVKLLDLKQRLIYAAPTICYPHTRETPKQWLKRVGEVMLLRLSGSRPPKA